MMVKTVLITGCSEGGIGDALAQEFYRQGVRVFATARDLGKIQHLKTVGLETLQLDVTSEESIQNAVTHIKKATGGKLDFLVNNAGIGRLLDAPSRHRLEDSQEGVRHELLVRPSYGINCSCKAALHMLGDTLRLELAPFGVQVVTVITGLVNTAVFENQAQYLEVPENSLYRSLQTQINYSGSAEEWRPWTEPADFAVGVVANALKKISNVWYWHGAKTFLTWFAVTFLPHASLDFKWLQISGLNTLHGKK
ncbi:related to 1-acyldihydroxyacetone-phosphate reductase [Phialocephala subalpina]|uniref:Related to 1-acyldihydroxyacetone-phosphate reductase n=1 Tax=Phialocephala subalpina TaxID=576137 RepID=A0A1L7X9S3_9HELO|nr:related to 1-acyldihydroxyacetone-phosphate reductase [Phialocephala subalpina]